MSETDNHCSSLIHVLKKLNPGTRVNEVFVNGVSESARYFAALDLDLNLAYFVQNDGDLLIVDSRRIDMIELGR